MIWSLFLAINLKLPVEQRAGSLNKKAARPFEIREGNNKTSLLNFSIPREPVKDPIPLLLFLLVESRQLVLSLLLVF